MLSALSLSASAFAPPAGVVPSRSSACAASTVQMAEMSTALPFLKRPPALDGSMAGDVGFDPLGFTTTITELGGDLKYVREAELMHGRVSMLATVGFWFPALVGKLPNPATAALTTDPIAVQYELPPAILGQLFFTMALCEGLRARFVYNSETPAGEHGFDPMGFLPKYCDTPDKMMKMKTAEIKHCRAAMVAITGFWFQKMVTGETWPLL